MRSGASRFLRSIVRKTTVMIVATAVSGGACSPLMASPRMTLRRRVASTAVASATAVTGGVFGAVREVGHTLSPSALFDRVRTAYFAANVPFGSTIVHEAKKNGLAPELLAAVIKAESKFRPNARSSAGAIGLMQLLPRTGRWMGVTDLFDPQQNIVAGARYLKYLSDEFGGNEQKVIAAYNAGDGNVRRFGGTPPFPETRSYLKIVTNYRNEFARSVSALVSAGGADAGL